MKRPIKFVTNFKDLAVDLLIGAMSPDTVYLVTDFIPAVMAERLFESNHFMYQPVPDSPLILVSARSIEGLPVWDRELLSAPSYPGKGKGKVERPRPNKRYEDDEDEDEDEDEELL
jgi:hypothetical protein